jgi:uncharacterized protein YjdB
MDPRPVLAATRVVIRLPDAVMDHLQFTLRTPRALQLRAATQDQNGNLFTDQIDWTSSSPAVATVDQTGLVTPKSLGAGTIVATSHANPAIHAAVAVVVAT